MCRSAYFFGVKFVVVVNGCHPGITPVVSKASSGAVEMMRVHETDKVADFIRVLILMIYGRDQSIMVGR